MYAEPPIVEHRGGSGGRLDPSLLARVKSILFTDGSSGATRSGASNTGFPEVTLSDPVPIPLLSTFDLPPTVERRS